MTELQFTQIMQQYEKLVYTICYQMVKSAATAEDLTQETFLSVWNHRASCPVDAPKAWLCRIAVNKAKDHLKSAAFRRSQSVDNEYLCSFQDSSLQPSELVESAESVAQITAAIKSLNPIYRTVSLLYFINDCSTQELSHQLARPRCTINTQLYRARHLLRNMI